MANEKQFKLHTIEDRETQAVELYLTRLGERGGGSDTWTADACRYTQ